VILKALKERKQYLTSHWFAQKIKTPKNAIRWLWFRGGGAVVPVVFGFPLLAGGVF
jgi:hypothetical protein